MVFLSRSLSFLGDFHFTVKVCLRWYTRCSLAVQAAVLILKPVLRISVFHQTNSSAGEGGRWRRKSTHLEKFQMMDFVVVVALLLFMLTYLVLLAALAAKMRSSTFQRTSFQTRVEARWIPGQVFYFLFFGFQGVFVLIFHWKMFCTQSLGESFQRLQLTNNVKGASIGHLLFWTLCCFLFFFCLSEYLKSKIV